MSPNLTWDEAEEQFPECSAYWDMLYGSKAAHLPEPTLSLNGEDLIASINGHGIYVWNPVAMAWIPDQPLVNLDGISPVIAELKPSDAPMLFTEHDKFLARVIDKCSCERCERLAETNRRNGWVGYAQ